MAKLHKLAAILTAGSVLGLFFASGVTLAANAASTAGLIVKTADSVTSDDSTDESDETAGEITRPDKPKPNERSDFQKKRHELRDKFGSKDSLGLPPIVIHPEDDGEDDDAAETKLPKTKPTLAPAPTASATATVDPSIKTGTSSLKGGTLVSNPPTVAGNAQNSAVSPGSATGTASQQQPAGSTNSVVSPNEATPIDIEKAEISRQTDADKFIEAATLSLGAMGIGALALGAVTVIRGKRQLKEQAAEYQYTSAD